MLPTLTLYTRARCHLCEQGQAQLERLEFRFELVDVDSSPELRAIYGDDVPVLALGERILAKGVLSKGRLSNLKVQLIRENAAG